MFLWGTKRGREVVLGVESCAESTTETRVPVLPRRESQRVVQSAVTRQTIYALGAI